MKLYDLKLFFNKTYIFGSLCVIPTRVHTAAFKSHINIHVYYSNPGLEQATKNDQFMQQATKWVQFSLKIHACITIHVPL